MLHNKYLTLCIQNNLFENTKLNAKSADSTDFRSIIEFLARQEEVKEHLKDVNLEEVILFCEKIYSEIKDKTSEELENYVKEILQQEAKSQDYKVEVYSSIYKASSEFWGNIRPQTKDDDSRMVIIADGIGGLAGLLFGGVCSVITGTAMSYMADEKLEADKDNLIGPPAPSDR